MLAFMLPGQGSPYPITQPVRRTDHVRRLSSLGATSLKEVGPGGVLTRLCRQIE